MLIGVDPDGRLNYGEDRGFQLPGAGALIDHVRQALENERLDPLPPVAAKIMTLREKQLGVVRVYESSDTPHILRDGTIYIREPAHDRRSRWLPAGADSHRRVIELALRGEQGRAAAGDRLRPGRLPLIDAATVGAYDPEADGTIVPRARDAAVAVRLAPLGQMPYGCPGPRWSGSSLRGRRTALASSDSA